MTKHRLLIAALLSSVILPVFAQPAPFDMTPENELVVAPPTPSVNQPAAAAAPAIVAPTTSDHYLLASPTLRLEGEENRQAVVVYLTEAQAAAPTRLQFSILNSVVVAPEISNLSVAINGNEVTRRPIASASSPTSLAVDIPAGILRQGANTVEFIASQRHRTDCTVESTYELWTEIAAATAKLSMDGANLSQVRQLADLAAVGVDAEGNTTVRLIAPNLGATEASQAAAYLAQELVLALRVPNLHIELATDLATTMQPGMLDVVLGISTELPAALAEYVPQSSAGPVAALVPRASGANTLLVSGPDWAAVKRAIDAILVAAPLSDERPRIDLPYRIPTLLGGETVTLASLGVPTVQFNGRRHTARFQFELPPDFYANNYGEAELVLDAAYSTDVLPGSEIDIYANTAIASATPLLRTDGGQLRNTIIRFPMSAFRPGRNEMDVVVKLNAQSDEACGPGWTGKAPVRFVFSSNTKFFMPEYARAAAVPNLQLLSGWAWPYAQQASVPLVIGQGPNAAVAAMTLLARVAAASGRALPVTVTKEADLQPNQDGILVVSLAEMSEPTLNRAGLTRGVQAAAGDDNDALGQFRSNGNQGNQLTDAAEWLLDRVGLRMEDLHILPRSDAPYSVGNGGVALAQSVQPEGGLWTVLTGTDDDALLTGMERLAVTTQWRQVAGRVSALRPIDRDVTSIASVAPVLIQTQPFSIWNFRLIAANWFSGNILVFALIIGFAAVVLMLATTLVLRAVGRRK